jgi:ABC-2 type transport system ATP-binding protein
MLDVRKVTFGYKKKMIFRDFSLALTQGKVYGLLGKNGTGKSTLLYLMSGWLLPQQGTVYYRGQKVPKRRPSTLADVFLVPEVFAFPNVTLRRFLSIQKPFYPRFSEDQLRRNLACFELEDLLSIHLGRLSLGQRKKVFMSFALATNTSLLLMDEPTNGLDIPGKSQFKRFVAANMEEDRTVVISTHQAQDVEQLIEQVMILEPNRLLLNVPTGEVCRKLRFVRQAGQRDRERALYVTPSLEGTQALVPNEEETEGGLNLELLFQAACEQPARLASFFVSSANSEVRL